jgi:methionyl aminopeptidase
MAGIELKSPEEIERMREAGVLLAQVFDEVLAAIEVGVTTEHLDHVAASAIRSRGARSSFLKYHDYPKTICASVNEEVVHGIPGRRVLREGDIVGIDIGLVYNAYHADRATTMPVGRVSAAVAQLLRVTKECLMWAIDATRVGNRLFDIGGAVEQLARQHGYGIVREYSGHGIGRRLHEAPQVPNYVPEKGTQAAKAGNPRLRPGMTLAIEPMINLGTWRTRTLDDKWTVVTSDGLPSAHFEHTVVVSENGPEILTGEQPSLEDLELDSSA